MTVTPPRTEGQTVDTAETLEAAATELAEWFGKQNAALVEQLESRMAEITNRMDAAPISDDLKTAIANGLLRKIEKLAEG